MTLGTIRILLIGLGSIALVFPLRAADEEKTETIHAVIRHDEWKGWGNGEQAPANLKQVQTLEKFTRYATPEGENPAFSGKVEGLDQMQGVEVGLVVLQGVQWLKADNYQWARVSSDGTFQLKAKKPPTSKTTLVLKAPKHPWTFLRAEFEPTESGSEILLRMPGSKRILITMEDSKGDAVNSFKAEIFNAYIMTDDAGNELRAQRYDAPGTSDGELYLELALEPRGLLISGKGIAPYYQVIDPRKADHFHFQMLAPAHLTGVVTRGGKPAADEEIHIYNGAAPLSASRRKTDKAGHFDIPDRVPGTHQIIFGSGDRQSKEMSVELKEGENKEITVDLDVLGPATKPSN